MKQQIVLKVNGKEYDLLIEPNRTLISVLREDLDLTGTKEGCGIGECGACTVLIDGKNVNACLAFAVDVAGQDILTIEGLAPKQGEVHPIQQAFIDHGAIQCGFCSPGMIMSTKALLDKNDAPSEAEIRQALSGNLCRCTGYVKIVDAVKSLSKNK